MSGTVHVIGAGLAGLSAATALAQQGRHVAVHESAALAGGRCRSYYDSVIDLVIDNGNHLLLSGNRAALEFLERIGTSHRLAGPERAEFFFADLASGERWTLRPSPGRLPWWIFQSKRRVPGSRFGDYLAPLGILRAPSGATVGEAMRCAGPLYDRLWHPVLLSALNTEVEAADAGLAANILRETLGAGGSACRPLIAVDGLGPTFIEPAIAYLAARGCPVSLGRTLRHIEFSGGRASVLQFAGDSIALAADDTVVLAVPSVVARAFVPGITGPEAFRSILNVHFKIVPPAGAPLMLGVVNALTEWLFAYPDRLSVTISCADKLLDRTRDDLAEAIWREVAHLTGLASSRPPWQIVRERRATFAATPTEVAKRPGPSTRFSNVVLAGDWTATGLPSTIEGSVRSGRSAAAAVVSMDFGRAAA